MSDNPISPIPVDLSERRVGISRDDYLELFLDEQDFGGTLQRVQDTRLWSPDPDDRAFPKYQGILTGSAIWMGRTDLPLWRVVDIRAVFPTAWQASAYHAARLEANSEGAIPVPDAPLIDQECQVFRRAAEMAGIQLTAFYYIFRVKRVVVRLFAMQRQETSNSPLTTGQIMPLVQRIVKRIKDNSE